MPQQIQSVDYAAKRAYLHADTVTNGFDVVLAYFEIATRVSINAGNEQNYRPVMSAEGNLKKTTGRYTAKYGLLEPGWRFVPVDTPHILRLLAEVISKDELVDRDAFDRTGITSNVDIDPVYELIEIREVNTGSGLTAQDKVDIAQQTRDLILSTETFP